MKKSKSKKAKIVGEPVIDAGDKRIIYCIEVGGAQGNAWEYKDTGEAALALVNFDAEIHDTKRDLVWSAVNEWRAANRNAYVELLGRL
jgi:hypothetical protein